MMLAALAALAAGCGTAVPARVAGRPSPSVAAAARRQPPWPRGGSRALARSAARRMLASLVLPPGSRRTSARAWPRRADVIGSDNLVDVHSFYLLPVPVDAAAAFLRAHAPAGLRADGTGGNGVATEEDVSFGFLAPPAGLTSDTELLVSLARAPHGTIARADAEVVWYPPRTPAEYLRAAAVRSAQITASVLNPRPRRFAKAVTSRDAIARLAALLDGMRAAGNSLLHCPMIDASYHVTFTGMAGRPRVVVDAAGCASDFVSVNGKDEPPLWDPRDRLIGALRRLLGLSARPR